MARKKEPSVDDALNIFKDVMRRASLSNYLYVNKIMFAKNIQDKSIFIIPDQELWLKIIDDPDIKPNLKELDISNPNEASLKNLFSYLEYIDDPSWIDIDIETLFAGKIYKISIDEFEYQIPINKNLLPLKLKKAEYNKITYRIFKGSSLVLGLKKRFDFPIENCGFSIIRLFKII